MVPELIELVAPHQPTNPTDTVYMEFSKAPIHRKTHRIPAIKFEDQHPTALRGLVMLQTLISRMSMKQQLSGCFRHLSVSSLFGHSVIVLLLIVHLCWATGGRKLCATARMVPGYVAC